MYKLTRSKRANKKYKLTTPDDKTIHFGQKGAEDFTTHGNEKRKDSYLARHKPREDWSKNGIDTAGFWARWLLWNKKSIRESVEDIRSRFNIDLNL